MKYKIFMMINPVFDVFMIQFIIRKLKTKLKIYLGIRDMDGNDGRMNVVRLNHLIEVAERFTQEEWRSSKVHSFDLLILMILTTNNQ